MKKLLLITGILISSFAFSQVEEPEPTEETEEVEEVPEAEETADPQPQDTTRFNIGDTEFLIINHDTIPSGSSSDMEEESDWDSYTDRRRMTYWTGFDIGLNVLMDGSKEFNNFNSSHLRADPSNSFNFSFNFLEQRIRIYKDYFGIVTGLGFTNSRFGFKDDRLQLAHNPDSTFSIQDTTLVTGYIKNQLRVNYFNIPLLLQFNMAKRHKKNFHIAFGVIGSVRMNANVKYKFETVTGEEKRKAKGSFNLNPFQLSSTVRMGFRNFGVFANYHFLPLFERSKSEVAYPLTFGMSIHM